MDFGDDVTLSIRKFMEATYKQARDNNISEDEIHVMELENTKEENGVKFLNFDGFRSCIFRKINQMQ